MGQTLKDYVSSLGAATELDLSEVTYLVQAGSGAKISKKGIVESPFVLSVDADGSDYVLSTSDAFKTIIINKSAANTITIPGNTFSSKDEIYIIRIGAGETTIVAGSGAPTLHFSLGAATDPGPNATNTITFYDVNDVYIANGTPFSISSANIITALGYTPANADVAWTRVDLTAADRVFSSTSYADITSLLFPITANARVEFRAVLYVDTADVTEGHAVAINGPTLTSTRYMEQTFTTSTGEIYKLVTSYDGTASSTATPTGCITTLYGRVLTSASGNIQLRFRTENGGINVTVLKGSYVEYRLAGF